MTVICEYAATCDKPCNGGPVDSPVNHKAPHEEMPVCRVGAAGGYCPPGATCRETAA